MSIIEEINQERRRQIEKGYDAAHDDDHKHGELAALAAGVAVIAQDFEPANWIAGLEIDPEVAPRWIGESLKRVRDNWGHDRVRLLVIAAALLVAEAERVQRLPE